jgi:hypothetical protein
MFLLSLKSASCSPPPALSANIDDTEIRNSKREDGELAIAAVLADVAMGDVIGIY